MRGYTVDLLYIVIIIHVPMSSLAGQTLVKKFTDRFVIELKVDQMCMTLCILHTQMA